MRFLCVAAVLLVACLSTYLPAYATTYMDVSISGDGARQVLAEQYGRLLCVWGSEEFTITVNSSYPEDIDTCWIYLDGTTSTGTTRAFTANGVRGYRGCAVIKYVDETYESMEFRLNPAFEYYLGSQALAPTTWTVPSDQTAAAIINSVARTDPNGSSPPDEYCVCPESLSCDLYIADQSECGPSGANPEECDSGDAECK